MQSKQIQIETRANQVKSIIGEDERQMTTYRT